MNFNVNVPSLLEIEKVKLNPENKHSLQFGIQVANSSSLMTLRSMSIYSKKMMSGPFTAVFNGMKLEVTEEQKDDRTTTLFLNGTHLDVTQMNQSGSMEGNGRPYREIMDTLGIPERTFYRYLSQAYEHDKQLLMEQERDII